MSRRLLSAAICAALAAHTVTAAPLPEPDRDSPRKLARVVVVGEDDHAKAQPGSASLIDAEEIRSAHVFSVSEALRKVAGIVTRDEEGFGIRPNIGIRGLNPTRSTKVLLMEDGIPAA